MPVLPQVDQKQFRNTLLSLILVGCLQHSPLATAEVISGSFRATVTQTQVRDSTNVRWVNDQVPSGIRPGDILEFRFAYETSAGSEEVREPGQQKFVRFPHGAAEIEVSTARGSWSSSDHLFISLENNHYFDNIHNRPSVINYQSTFNMNNAASTHQRNPRHPDDVTMYFAVSNVFGSVPNTLLSSLELPRSMHDIDLTQVTHATAGVSYGVNSKVNGQWVVRAEIIAGTFQIGAAPDQYSSNPHISDEESRFLDDIERVDTQLRQRLGMRIGPIQLIGPEGPILSGMHEILKDRYINAETSQTSNNCEKATWEIATELAAERFVAEGVAYLTDSLLIGTVDVALAPFSMPSKLLIAESMKFGLGLVNDHHFGLLKVDDIPEDAARRLTQITIGYTFPMLVNVVLEWRVNPDFLHISSQTISSSLLGTYLNNEHLVQVAIEGNATPRLGGPQTYVRVGALYNEDTHFVTMFVRADSASCDERLIRILRFEVNEHGLPVDRQNVLSDEIYLR